MNPAQRMAKLFDGYTRAYGRWIPGKPEANGKIKGRSKTERGTVSPDHFASHLAGTESLGVIMLRDDDTVLFGAIDFDNRTVDHAVLAANVEHLELPLVVCRSKSGGAHLYCFTTEPVEAGTMIKALARWAALLGLSKTGDYTDLPH